MSVLADHLKTVLSYEVIESIEYEAINSTLLISIPGAAKNDGLILLDDGKLYKFAMPGCSGLCIHGKQLWVAMSTADYMRLFVFEPEKETRTIISCELGDIHDIRFLGDELYVVSTSTNEVVTIDSRGRLIERWKFPGAGDAWHLNGIDVWDGKVVLSAFGKFTFFRDYKGGNEGKGIVFDLLTQEILFEDFTEPHTPRRDESGRFYVCNSKLGMLASCKDGAKNSLSFPGAFPRGLAFTKSEIYVGLSSLRHRVERDDWKKAMTTAQVATLDRQSLDIKAKISLPQAEIYDILVLNDQELGDPQK